MNLLSRFAEVPEDRRLWLLVGSRRDASNAALQLVMDDYAARSIRGTKMRSVPRLFDEVAAAYQFPYYFGENWPAFDECLCDMDWLPTGHGIVVVVENAREVLADEPDRDLEVLIRILETARETYAEPIERGESWDRPAVPFHVVLQAEPDEVAALTERWTAAGATLEPLPPARAHGA